MNAGEISKAKLCNLHFGESDKLGTVCFGHGTPVEAFDIGQVAA